MAGRAKYTEEDKARIFVVLSANGGNVKRTARETGVPENTVRRWRDEWAKEGPPSTDLVEQEVGNFVEDSTRVRHKALMQIEKKIDDPKTTVSALVAVVGVLTEKMALAQGLATKRVEHEHHLPAADQIREALTSFMGDMRAMSESREAEIVDAEIVEQPALPAGK